MYGPAARQRPSRIQVAARLPTSSRSPIIRRTPAARRLAALFNAVLLLVAVGAIAWEAVLRLSGRLFAALNVSYEPEQTRLRTSAETLRDSMLGIGAALAMQAFIGAEARILGITRDSA